MYLPSTMNHQPINNMKILVSIITILSPITWFIWWKNTIQEVDVYRNDEIALEKVKDYDKIILSPGPGIPEEAGLLLPLIKSMQPPNPFSVFVWVTIGNRRSILR